MKNFLLFCLLALSIALSNHSGYAQSTLIHYWNFNTLLTAYHNPGIPSIAADYSVIDTSKARIVYTLQPGTSNTYPGYIDNVASADTINLRLGAVAGQALRVRNPTDSIELRFRIPTTGFKNIALKYALESSSLTSGMLAELFDYSVDGGTTWKNKSAGLTVNGINADTLDVRPDKYQGANWGLVSINFGTDTTVNNNPNLIFRIKFRGNITGGSGNNRFDDVTVEGTGAAKPPPATITTVRPAGGDILVVGRHATISFTTFGPVTAARTIEYSPDGGTTWSPVGTVNAASTYDWIVPNTPTTSAIIRVKDGNGIFSMTAKFTIYAVNNTTNTLVHYWHFNSLLKQYNNPGIPAIKADFSARESNSGYIAYVLEPGASSNYAGYIDNVAGDTLNSRLGASAGQGLRIRNPTDSMELRFYVPTVGFKNIALKYDLQSSDPLMAPLAQHFDYSVDSGLTWKTIGLNITLDSVTQAQYQNLTKFGLVSLNFGADTTVNNNAKLVFRIKFSGMTSITSGNNRFDNVTVDGAPMAPSGVNTLASTPVECLLYPNPSKDHIAFSTSAEGLKTISIADVEGKIVFTSKGVQRDISVGTAGFRAGTYFVNIIDANTGKQNTIKFVKE